MESAVAATGDSTQHSTNTYVSGLQKLHCCKNCTACLQGPELNDEQREQEVQWGPPRGDPSTWASCLRVVDPTTLETASVVELDNNEAAICMCCVRFSAAQGHMLAVGTVQGLGFYPRAADGGLTATPPTYHCTKCIHVTQPKVTSHPKLPGVTPTAG